MRKFRFIGDPEDYDIWKIKPVVNQVYDWELFKKNHGTLKDRDIDCFYEDEDWEEVIDNPKPLHKDTDLGYFAGVAMQSILLSDSYKSASARTKVENAIFLAKELIKQLDQEAK